MLTRDEIDAADFKATGLFFDAVLGFYDLSQRDALDMFARDGALTVHLYADKVRSLDLWEIDPIYEPTLRKFTDNVHIGCSHKQLMETDRTYGFMVLDAPEGVYHDWRGRPHSEHFDLIPQLPRIMANNCIVVVYVNKEPYDASKVGSHGRDVYPGYDYQAWMQRRADFYHTDHPNKVSTATALQAYRREFRLLGFDLKSELIVPAYDMGIGMPPSFRLAMELERF